MNYLEFIRSKIEQAPVSGFDIDTGECIMSCCRIRGISLNGW